MNIINSGLLKSKIAHRGLHNDVIPENSLGAFNNAIEHGFAIELDVRCLEDDALVVFHDDCLSRMTGKSGYACRMNEGELKDIRLLKTDEKIPLFGEVLELIGGRVPLLIEIKNPNKVGATEQKTLKLLEGYKGEFAVQSFNPYSLEYFRHNAPDMLRCQLSSFFKNADLSKFKRFALKRMLLNKFSQPHMIAYDFADLPNRWVSKTKLPVIAWTIRSQADYESVKDYCDNIIFEGFIPI